MWSYGRFSNAESKADMVKTAGVLFPLTPPSPRGRGWGEGKQDTRSLDHVRFRLSIRKPPVGPHVFEPFIISSLRLCQRSLMICIPTCSFSPSLTFTFLVANHVDDLSLIHISEPTR